MTRSLVLTVVVVLACVFGTAALLEAACDLNCWLHRFRCLQKPLTWR